MERNEALEQIDYLKKIVSRTKLRAEAGYPFLFLWGIIWIVGYISTIWVSDFIWMIIGAIGGIASALIGIKWNWPENGDITLLKKLYLQSGIVFVVLIFYPIIVFDSTITCFDPKIFWPLIVGIIYILWGVMIGRSMIVLGIVLVITSYIAKFLESPLQNIWLAVVGGGALIISSLIFRNQVKRCE